MKKTMTSINPPFSQLILDGIKKIEWRTKPLPLGWSELYETKKKGGCGKVMGQFEVVENIKFNLKGDTYKKSWLEKGCVPYEFLVEYAKGKDYLYANVIDRVERYKKPKELGEFRKPCKFAYSSYEEGICYEDCIQGKLEDCRNFCLPITRPFQSWGYIESLGE
jgi:predicted transcriptional regulator